MRGAGRSANVSFPPTPLIRRLISALLCKPEGDTFSHKGRRDGAWSCIDGERWRERAIGLTTTIRYVGGMPHQAVPTKNRRYARVMPGDLTDAEAKLWDELRDRRLDGVKFRRQVPIGRYIADFACLEGRLVIELDGGQHSESRYDAVRDAELKARGFRILRFWNDEVTREMDAVCTTIIAYVRDPNAQPWR